MANIKAKEIARKDTQSEACYEIKIKASLIDRIKFLFLNDKAEFKISYYNRLSRWR